MSTTMTPAIPDREQMLAAIEKAVATYDSEACLFELLAWLQDDHARITEAKRLLFESFVRLTCEQGPRCGIQSDGEFYCGCHQAPPVLTLVHDDGSKEEVPS